MRFSISVLAYQNIALTRRCLASVMEHSGDYELILTDNGCSDGTGAYFDEIERAHPDRTTVFHEPKNTGFIEPNRRAFKVARGDFLVLLNNDTVVPPGWLETLHAPFLLHRDCALSAPGGGCCQLRGDFHGEIGSRLEYLEGSCLMIDIAKVKPLEPRLFPEDLVGAYGEDSYLSLRVRSAGYTILTVPLGLSHVRGATSAMVPQCREWQEKNHAFLSRRFAKYMKGHRFDYPIIVRRNAAWGDVLLTTPVIRALKERNSLCRIQVETGCPDVFNGNANVSYVANRINVTSADTEENNLNGVWEMRPDRHIVDVFAETVGLKPGEYRKVTKLYPPQGDVEWARRTITSREWIAVHPGPTNWRCKNWNFDRWREVLEYIRNKMRYAVMLVGNDAMPPLPCDLDLRSKTNVGQLAALLGECRMFVGLDSFPIHAAQAMGRPVVGLFGITSPELLLTDGSLWFAARSPADHPATGLRHRKPGLTHVDHPDNPMDAITVENVVLTIQEANRSCMTNA